MSNSAAVGYPCISQYPAEVELYLLHLGNLESTAVAITNHFSNK